MAWKNESKRHSDVQKKPSRFIVEPNLGKVKAFAEATGNKKLLKELGGVALKRGKARYVWELPNGSWRWVSTRYEGSGIFYGQVFTPYTPYGEFGTWYYYEIKDNGANLVEGNKEALDITMNDPKLLGTMKMQKTMMGALR